MQRLRGAAGTFIRLEWADKTHDTAALPKAERTWQGEQLVKQSEAAVHNSTGRAVEGLRPKSTSSVRPFTIAHTSPRLFLPSRFRFPAWVNVSAGRSTASSSKLA